MLLASGNLQHNISISNLNIYSVMLSVEDGMKKYSRNCNLTLLVAARLTNSQWKCMQDWNVSDFWPHFKPSMNLYLRYGYFLMLFRQYVQYSQNTSGWRFWVFWLESEDVVVGLFIDIILALTPSIYYSVGYWINVLPWMQFLPRLTLMIWSIRHRLLQSLMRVFRVMPFDYSFLAFTGVVLFGNGMALRPVLWFPLKRRSMLSTFSWSDVFQSFFSEWRLWPANLFSTLDLFLNELNHFTSEFLFIYILLSMQFCSTFWLILAALLNLGGSLLSLANVLFKVTLAF